MKVLVLHTLPPAELSSDRYPWEFALDDAAHIVSAPLSGAVVRGVRGDPREILELLEQNEPDVVFNLCEAPLGRPDLEAHAAALFEWAGVRFTGCGSQTLALCRRKDLTNAVLRAAGVRVPDDVDPRNPAFPCIVKPADEDGSARIHQSSVCENHDQLERAISGQPPPVIVQEFAPGREFAVSLWGRSSPDFDFIEEVAFENGLRLITYAAKWDIDSDDQRDAPRNFAIDITPNLRHAILQAARGAWQAVGARHFLRVDVRLNASGVPLVLDVNSNPEIYPEQGICRAVQEAGWRWEDFVVKLVEWA